MRVAIGAVAGTIGGPATYAAELVRALVGNHPSDDWIVLTDRPDLYAGFVEAVNVPLASAWEQPLWDHVRVPRALRRLGVDLYHGTKGVVPFATRVPSVVTIHDLAVRVLPETFNYAQRAHLAVETPHALVRARAVITVSDSTARDIARFYPFSSAERVHVVASAVSREIRPASVEAVAAWRSAHGLVGPTVGYLGTLQPRKNVDLLADAFAAAAGGAAWKLLIAGRARPGYRPRCLDAGDDRIVELGTITDDEVPLFLGAIDCMVSPSSYEGFGLSFIEAMAAGCPVIGLANSSVPEVVGDAGVLLPDADRERLADAIRRVVTDRGLAADLSERGLRQAAKFSWVETARRTHAVYRGALEDRS